MALKNWSTDSSSNVSGLTGINWNEGMSPAAVNDSARATMAQLAVWRDQIKGGTIYPASVGGTANAITLTCSPTIDAYATGQRFLFKASSTNTGSTTINVDSLGAKTVQFAGANLNGGEITSGDLVTVSYDGTYLQLLSTPRVIDPYKILLSNYSTLDAADTAAQAVGGYISLNKDITLAADTTITSRVVGDGGVITRGSYTLTFSGDFSSGPNTKCFDSDGTGLVTFPATVVIHAAWFGMAMDGSTEDTTPLQQAINAGDAQTGFDQGTQHGNLVSVIVPQGKTVTSNITVPPMVRLIADGASDVGGYASSYPSTQITAKTGTTGFLIDTDNSIHNDGCGLVGIALVGLGSGTALGGVRLRNTFRGCVSFCTFDNFADEAIYLTSNSKACTIRENLGQGCLLDRTRSAATGVLHVEGSDHWILQGEYTASSSVEGAVSDSNLYCAAVYVGGSTVFLNEVIGEISDVGFVVTGQGRNIFLGCRADQNYGHGYKISSDGLFTGCRSLSNGKGATNTYDGFHITSGVGHYTGCFDDVASGSGGSIRYSFYDSQASDANKNAFTGCRGSGFSTAEFSFDTFSGAASDMRFSAFRTLTANSTTPTISGLSSYRTANTAGTAYTDFLSGRSGQILIIQCQDSNSSLTNSGNIRTFSGGTETMINNRLYFLYNYNGKWWEMGFNAKMTDIGALTISAGTPGTTISDVGSSFSQTTLNNNLASLGTQINAIRTALRGAGLMT